MIFQVSHLLLLNGNNCQLTAEIRQITTKHKATHKRFTIQ